MITAGKPQRTAHIRITGHVQGVFFRAWTERNAVSLGLAGWVRNRRDGSLEALFSGQADAVAEMLRRCLDGPPNAVVARVEQLGPIDEKPIGFTILRTT